MVVIHDDRGSTGSFHSRQQYTPKKRRAHCDSRPERFDTEVRCAAHLNMPWANAKFAASSAFITSPRFAAAVKAVNLSTSSTSSTDLRLPDWLLVLETGPSSTWMSRKSMPISNAGCYLAQQLMTDCAQSQCCDTPTCSTIPEHMKKKVSILLRHQDVRNQTHCLTSREMLRLQHQLPGYYSTREYSYLRSFCMCADL